MPSSSDTRVPWGYEDRLVLSEKTMRAGLGLCSTIVAHPTVIPLLKDDVRILAKLMQSRISATTPHTQPRSLRRFILQESHKMCSFQAWELRTRERDNLDYTVLLLRTILDPVTLDRFNSSPLAATQLEYEMRRVTHARQILDMEMNDSSVTVAMQSEVEEAGAGAFTTHEFDEAWQQASVAVQAESATTREFEDVLPQATSQIDESLRTPTMGLALGLSVLPGRAAFRVANVLGHFCGVSDRTACGPVNMH